MPVDTYRTQSRGGRGVNAQNLKEEDYVKSLTIASTHDHMLFFTDQGRVHHRKGYQIPEAGRTVRGTAIVNVLPLNPGESVTAMVITREFDENEFLMMVTREGHREADSLRLPENQPQGGHPRHHPGRGRPPD